MGTTQEFSHPDAPAFPALARGSQRDIVGGGPFDLEPGQGVPARDLLDLDRR
jgi:hypothetical protein